jgi:hypothetical protein
VLLVCSVNLLLLLLLQGLLSRPDWDAARLLPIAHVPGGSGNGLAHSCGLQDAATAAFCICKGVVSPMDVASVLQAPAAPGASPRRMYSMLMATVSVPHTVGCVVCCCRMSYMCPLMQLSFEWCGVVRVAL